MFYFKFFSFWFLNILLYFSIFTFLYSYKNRFSFIERSIITFILYIIVIFAIFIPLYYFHLFTLKFILSEILFFGIVFILYGLKIKEKVRGSYNEIKDFSKKFIHEIKNTPFLLILFLLTFLNFFLIFIFSLISHPYGYDVYVYHLPVVARIAVEKGLPHLELFNLGFYEFYFPKNVEILCSFYYIFVGTLKGILTIHFPFLFFGGLASYSILRKLNIPPNKALYIFSLLQMPVITNLSHTLYVDLEISFIFLIFLFFILIDFPYNLFFSLITLSFGCGIKYSPLVVFFIFLIYTYFKFIKNKKYFLLLSSIFLCILTSLHFYLYNFISKTNPLFPFEIKLFNISIFKGPAKILKTLGNLPVFTYDPFIIFSHLFEFASDNYEFYAHDNLSAGFGHFIPIVFLPFLIFLFFLIKDKDKRILKIFLFTFLFFFTSPFRWWPRFQIYLCCVLLIFSIYVWERLKDQNFGFLIIFIALLSFFESHHDTFRVFSPYFSLFSHKENAFEIPYIPSQVLRTYHNISFYIEKGDKIAVWDKDWPGPPYPNLTKHLIGLILVKDIEIKYDAVYDFDKLKFYNKVIAPPHVEFLNYKKLYADENLSFWVK